jgi:hypothetical protein
VIIFNKKGKGMTSGFRTLAAISLSIFSFSAFALSDQEAADRNITQTINPTKPGFHPAINVGVTYGGDTIATARYSDGSTTDIKGGALLQFGLGGVYQFENRPLALMLTANYHYHSAMGQNGDITFSRIPLEALVYYTGKERFRIGGGMRIVNSPEFNASVNGVTNKIAFNRATGMVAEVGYQLSTQGWLNFRFVSEKYDASSITWSNGAVTSLVGLTAPVSGSHMGVNFTYEF